VAESSNRKRRVTVRQVAQAAGVSAQTVSNFINGRPKHMGPETELRVREAIEQLDYRPNLVARGLRSSRANVLAFLVMDASPRFLADPMTDMFLSGFGNELRENSQGLQIQSASPGSSFDTLVRPIREGRVDGAAVFLSGSLEERTTHIQQLAELDLPTILLQEHGLDPQENASVTAADRDGARRLCEHMISQGHRRLAFLTASDSWSAIEERIAGFFEAHEAAGVTPRRDAIQRCAAYSPLDAASTAEKFLDSPRRPSAVLCGNDLIALGVLKAARAAHLKVPEQLAVAGFDDFEFATAVDPPLTTVGIPGFEMGLQAARMLLEAIDTGAPVRSRRFPVEVNLRGSA